MYCAGVEHAAKNFAVKFCQISQGTKPALMWVACICWQHMRRRGRVVRVPDLNSGDPESDHQLGLFEVVPSSTPRLRLYIANWSASCQLGFLTC